MPQQKNSFPPHYGSRVSCTLTVSQKYQQLKAQNVTPDHPEFPEFQRLENMFKSLKQFQQNQKQQMNGAGPNALANGAHGKFIMIPSSLAC